MGPPSEILPNLFLGNFENARDASLLEKLGIDRVLTIGNRSPIDNCILNAETSREPRFNDETGVTCKLIYAMDSTDQNILKYFRECFAFIRDGLIQSRGRAVLVHCQIGHSRSAALVIGYLMHEDRLSYPQAFDRVRKKRIIGPNSGFEKQLRLFHKLEWDLMREYDDDFVLDAIL